MKSVRQKINIKRGPGVFLKEDMNHVHYKFYFSQGYITMLEINDMVQLIKQ